MKKRVSHPATSASSSSSSSASQSRMLSLEPHHAFKEERSVNVLTESIDLNDILFDDTIPFVNNEHTFDSQSNLHSHHVALASDCTIPTTMTTCSSSNDLSSLAMASSSSASMYMPYTNLDEVGNLMNSPEVNNMSPGNFLSKPAMKHVYASKPDELGSMSTHLASSSVPRQVSSYTNFSGIPQYPPAKNEAFVSTPTATGKTGLSIDYATSRIISRNQPAKSKPKSRWRVCMVEGCKKAAQTKRLCTAHGGGPRCTFAGGCSKRSQGNGFCRAHGGGRRCMSINCPKSAQRGLYCAAHGGVKLCNVVGCMRNVRGNGKCAFHGGGKRCSIEGCGQPCRTKGLCTFHNNMRKRQMKLQDGKDDEKGSSSKAGKSVVSGSEMPAFSTGSTNKDKENIEVKKETNQNAPYGIEDTIDRFLNSNFSNTSSPEGKNRLNPAA